MACHDFNPNNKSIMSRKLLRSKNGTVTPASHGSSGFETLRCLPKNNIPAMMFLPKTESKPSLGNILETTFKKNKQILISSKQSNQYLSNIGGKKVLPSKRRNHCNLDAKFYHQIYSINPENQSLDLSCHWCGLERFNSEPCGKNRVKQNPSFVGGS